MFTDLYRQWIFMSITFTYYCKFTVHYNVLQKVSNLKWPSLQQYIKLQLFWHRPPYCPFLTLNCGTSAGTSEAIFVILGNDFFSSLVQWYHDAWYHFYNLNHWANVSYKSIILPTLHCYWLELHIEGEALTIFVIKPCCGRLLTQSGVIQ